MPDEEQKQDIPAGLRRYQAEQRRLKAGAELEAQVEAGLEEAPPELSGTLASVFRAIQQAQQQKTSGEALKTIRDALAELSEDDRKALTSTDEFQNIIKDAAIKGADRLGPGTSILDRDGRAVSKVPWTAGDIREKFPMVTWTPIMSRPLTVFGHTIVVEAGVDVTAPSCFKEVYDHALESMRSEHEHNLEAVAMHGGGIPTHSVGWFREE